MNAFSKAQRNTEIIGAQFASGDYTHYSETENSLSSKAWLRDA